MVGARRLLRLVSGRRFSVTRLVISAEGIRERLFLSLAPDNCRCFTNRCHKRRFPRLRGCRVMELPKTLRSYYGTPTIPRIVRHFKLTVGGNVRGLSSFASRGSPGSDLGKMIGFTYSTYIAFYRVRPCTGNGNRVSEFVVVTVLDECNCAIGSFCVSPEPVDEGCVPFMVRCKEKGGLPLLC